MLNDLSHSQEVGKVAEPRLQAGDPQSVAHLGCALQPPVSGGASGPHLAGQGTHGAGAFTRIPPGCRSCSGCVLAASTWGPAQCRNDT